MALAHPTKLVLELVSQIPDRYKDILVKRYGLVSGEKRTLEDVGNDYNITRERIRQIEEVAFNRLLKLERAKELEPIFDLLYSHLQSYGDVRHEDKLLIHDAGRIFKVNENDEKFIVTIFFILTVGDAFDRFAQTPKYHSAWTIDKNSFFKARNILDRVTAMLNKRKEVVRETELLEMMEIAAKKYLKIIDEKILRSYLELSKDIASNIYGQYGLRYWPEINPRSMRERAYLIFKKENRPLHFREVADLINKSGISSKPAHQATVHNDLIRDGRFVLCGRGLYALKDWGYEDGTVKDLLIRFFEKNSRPKTKEEIIEYIMSQRQVKPGTIVLSLQDKETFNKLADGRFQLV